MRHCSGISLVCREEVEHALHEQRSRLLVVLGEIVLGARRGARHRIPSRQAAARSRSPRRRRGCAAAAARRSATSPASCRRTRRAAGPSSKAPRHGRPDASERAPAPTARRGKSRCRRPRLAATRQPHEHGRRSPSDRRVRPNAPSRHRSCGTSGRRRGQVYTVLSAARSPSAKRRTDPLGRERDERRRPQPSPSSIGTRWR